MKYFQIFLALAALLFTGLGINAKETDWIGVRYDNRSVSLDPDFRTAKSYYDSYEFGQQWRQATARPQNGEADYILWLRTFPSSDIIKSAQQDSLSVYSYRRDYAQFMNKMAAKLYHNLGQRLPSEKDYSYFNSIHPGFPYPPSYQEIVGLLINTLVKEKDIEKAQEDFARGIISKKLSKAVQHLMNSTGEEYNRHLRDLRSINELGVVGFTKEKWGKNLAFEDIELIDTIPNPWNRKKLMLETIECGEDTPVSHLSKLFWIDINGSAWDWILDEEPQEKQEQYPISVTYDYYDSHPEYRIIKDPYNDYYFAFDEKGMLQRVIMPKHDMWWQYMGRHDSDIGHAIAMMAYENNDYNIKSAQQSSLKYVRGQLGLQKLTGKARAQVDKAGKEMAKAYGQAIKDDIRYGNSRKGEEAFQKNASNFFGAMLSAASANYDEAGSGWFAQIKQDYWEITSHPQLIFQ